MIVETNGATLFQVTIEADPNEMFFEYTYTGNLFAQNNNLLIGMEARDLVDKQLANRSRIHYENMRQYLYQRPYSYWERVLLVLSDLINKNQKSSFIV